MRSHLLLLLSLVAAIVAPRIASATTELHDDEPSMFHVSSASHSGTWLGDRIEWRSRFDPRMVTGPRPETWRLRFAIPLPPGTRISGDRGFEIAPVYDEDRYVVGVDLGSRYGAPPTHLTTVVPLPEGADPPLPIDAPQVIELSGARVRPDARSPLQLRLTSIRHRKLDRATMERLEDRWGESVADARPVFLLADDAYVESGGLRGRLVSTDEAASKKLAVLAGALVVVLLALAGILRRVSRSARAEEAEAFLQDFDLTEADDW